jgi:hypothetical protein
MEDFETDWKHYFKTLSTAADFERKTYDEAFQAMFDKLNITQANFERS